MTPEQLNIIKAKLAYWGRKSASENRTGCGWPHESIEYKLMREAAGASQVGRNVRFIEYDEEYQSINRAVMDLRPIELMLVVKLRYSRPDINKPWGADFTCKSKTTFYNWLNRAYKQLIFLA